MWLVEYGAMGLVLGMADWFIFGPDGVPGWVWCVEMAGFFILILCIEVSKSRLQQEREDRLELQKHLMTLQFGAGRMEPPRDDTRLPPEMLRAFERQERQSNEHAASTA